MAFGLADNIFVYSYLLKRRSWTNIILGGFSGGAPAMIGYVAVTTQGLWDLGLIMAALVFVLVFVTMYAKSLDEMHNLVSGKIGLIQGVISSESFIEMKTRTKPMPYMPSK